MVRAHYNARCRTTSSGPAPPAALAPKPAILAAAGLFDCDKCGVVVCLDSDGAYHCLRRISFTLISMEKNAKESVG